MKQVLTDRSNHFLAVSDNKIDHRNDDFKDKFVDGFYEFLVFLDLGRKFLFPLEEQRHESQSSRLNVNHAAATDGSWGRNSQVFDFEHHRHVGGQSQDLSTVETQFLVIIKDCVHVLNPDGVNRAIEHDPVFLGRSV